MQNKENESDFGCQIRVGPLLKIMNEVNSKRDKNDKIRVSSLGKQFYRLAVKQCAIEILENAYANAVKNGRKTVNPEDFKELKSE